MSRPRGVALITGASAGLGAEFARQLAASHDLVLVARREDRLEGLARQLEARHDTVVTTIVADLADPGAPARVCNAVATAGLHVDVLVNNAGSAGPHLLADRDWAAHRDFFQLMVVSTAEFCHRLVPLMLERGYGRVINVASVAGLMTMPAGAQYGPAKRHVIGVSQELMAMVGRRGVHVCAVCPGFTHTEFHDSVELAKMKKASPGFLWYDARTVVSEGLRAVEKGVPVLVTGRLYRWLAPFMGSRLMRWAVSRRFRR